MEKGQKDFLGKEYLNLAELAQGRFFSLEYLLIAVKNRHLKAFKSGEDWFTTYNWFSDFKDRLKEDINSDASDSCDGVRLLPEKDFFWIRFWRFLKPALIASFLSTMVLVSIWFVLPESGRDQILSLSEKAVSFGRVAGIMETLPKNGF